MTAVGGVGGIGNIPPLAAAMAEAGFKDIGVYVTRSHNTFVQYIATRPILNLCERSVQRMGAWVSGQWREKEGLDLEGAKERAETGLEGEEAQCKEGAAQEEIPGQE